MSEKPGGESAPSAGSVGGAAPSAELLLAALGVLLAPLLLAAAVAHLPAVLRVYAPRTPLPLLEIQVALAFALLALPAFKAPAPAQAHPALTGLARGLFAGLVALPFVLAARADAPMAIPAVLAGCGLAAATGAGAAAAAAAYGAKGIAAAAAAAALPGVLGFLAPMVGLALGWLERLCPFVAAESAAGGEAAWTLGLLPGLGLVVASLLARRGAE